MKGSYWFRRLKKELQRKSPHLRFKEIRLGFYRIYYKGFYIGEAYKEMPAKGYDIEHVDVRLEKQSYYEEFEDQIDTTRKIKNFVEGYFESKDSLLTRLYLLRTDVEFYNNSRDAYKQMYIK